MDIIRFDRHSNMDETTTSEILKLTTEVMVEDGKQSLINSLYGLFDGYFYTDILQETKGLSPETINRINKVLDVVKTYPAI